MKPPFGSTRDEEHELRPVEVRRGDDLFLVCGVEGCGEPISGAVGLGDSRWYGGVHESTYEAGDYREILWPEERALICLCDAPGHPGHETKIVTVYKRR